MTDREKVIRGLECHFLIEMAQCEKCPYYRKESCTDELAKDALALLKAQDVATVEPKRIELDDETKAWLDTMDAVDALGNIADICMDWDGYRTADGLGGLINEIWAYARYCAERLLKAQGPRVMTWEEAQANVNEGPFIIIEVRDSTGTEIDYGVLVGDSYEMSEGSLLTVCDFWMLEEEYGKRFRCWTSRPTDEQREATPWILAV